LKYDHSTKNSLGSDKGIHRKVADQSLGLEDRTHIDNFQKIDTSLEGSSFGAGYAGKFNFSKDQTENSNLILLEKSRVTSAVLKDSRQKNTYPGYNDRFKIDTSDQPPGIYTRVERLKNKNILKKIVGKPAQNPQT
jgi:hypothetical protein